MDIQSGSEGPVITKDMMFPPVLEASPSFQAAWDEFLDEWKDTLEGPQYYLALSGLARHLISLLERNEIRQISDVFRIVEEWHLRGDRSVREAATVGVLEDLQNENLHTATTKPNDFLPYLLPETKFWWAKVIDFWERGKLIVDDRANH